jgi:hypothetical protein
MALGLAHLIKTKEDFSMCQNLLSIYVSAINALEDKVVSEAEAKGEPTDDLNVNASAVTLAVKGTYISGIVIGRRTYLKLIHSTLPKSDEFCNVLFSEESWFPNEELTEDKDEFPEPTMVFLKSVTIFPVSKPHGLGQLAMIVEIKSVDAMSFGLHLQPN